jgi:basic amino acid/polyamine antiporter, APA family
MSDRPSLRRSLGPTDAVVMGLGAMIGAGVFSAIGPAAEAAGPALLLGLVVAAAVAFCNAVASAQLAAVYPESGGTYVYGRERLGAVWGFLAGWGFVVGKTASLTAMALTVGAYLAPGSERLVAVVALVAMTVVNLVGIRKTAAVTWAIVAIVLAVLAAAVIGTLFGGTASADRFQPFVGDDGLLGILRSAGLLFFAFAGYARIATLGEEVREPDRTIPWAIPRALGIVIVVYGVVAASAIAAVGAPALGSSTAPLATAVAAGSESWLEPIVRAGAGIAALGVLLSLLAGVSRTILAMARDAELPRGLAAVHERYRTPWVAELTVGAVVLVATLLVDLRGAIGFSSFTVLTYYAIANASAWTQPPEQRRWPRWLNVAGVIGCVVLAATLPLSSVVLGIAVLAVGVTIRLIRRRSL